MSLLVFTRGGWDLSTSCGRGGQGHVHVNEFRGKRERVPFPRTHGYPHGYDAHTRTIFVVSEKLSKNLLARLVERLGTAAPETRTAILACLNSFPMPEYLLPAFLSALESDSWQTRMQAVLALQVFPALSVSQRGILNDALVALLDSEGKELVKQAVRQTLALWEEWDDHAGTEMEESGDGGAAIMMGNSTLSGTAALSAVVGGGTAHSLVGGTTGATIMMGGGSRALGTSGGGDFRNSIDSTDSGGSWSTDSHLASLGSDPSPVKMPNSSSLVEHQFSAGTSSSVLAGPPPTSTTGASVAPITLLTSTASDGARPALTTNANGGAGDQQFFCIPESFLDKLRDSCRVLEDIHQCILGGSLGFEPATTVIVSLLDMGVLKRLLDTILVSQYFKFTLTGLYVIGDLAAPQAGPSPPQKQLQQTTLKVLPLVLDKILDKLGDQKLVIRQTTMKLLLKIFALGPGVPDLHVPQMLFLMFEAFDQVG